MKQPPYHLRPNKAVDRFVFMDAIRRLSAFEDLDEYRYYSLGGPFLEDFRLIYESFPQLRLTSVESSSEILKRQRFHRPCNVIDLRPGDVASFLATYRGDEKSIFWLDYTGLRIGHFDDLMSLLPKVSPNSLVKITLEAEPKRFIELSMEEQERRADAFRREFDMLLPEPSANPPATLPAFARLLQQMVRSASERSLSGSLPLVFLPLCCFYYADGVGMFTLTGMVCKKSEVAAVKRYYANWEFVNHAWKAPRLIDLPILSTKERLHLQRLLPCRKRAGKRLRVKLGYLIENDLRATEDKLTQYAVYHRLSPYFMRGVP